MYSLWLEFLLRQGFFLLRASCPYNPWIKLCILGYVSVDENTTIGQLNVHTVESTDKHILNTSDKSYPQP